MLVNAVTKVEVQTERIWKRARELGVSRVVAVNMMDRERADFGEAVAALKARFGDEVVAVALPIGEEAGFKGIVDLLAMKAYTYSGATGKGDRRPHPRRHAGCRGRRPARSSSTGWPRPTTPCSRSTWKAPNSPTRRSPTPSRPLSPPASVCAGHPGVAPPRTSVPTGSCSCCSTVPSPVARGARKALQGARRRRGRPGLPTSRRPPRSSSSRPSTTSSPAA